MKYVAILGRQPEFGLLELESLLGAAAVEPFSDDSALLDSSPHLPTMGGSIKIGRVIYRGKPTSLTELPVEASSLPFRDSKTPFGLSVYGSETKPKQVLSAGLTLKKQFKPRSTRFIAPDASALSAAQLKFNKVIIEGFELLVVISKKEMVVAITEQVQDIDWYSKRDYERPARSAKVGMFPPKLAQIIINTTPKDSPVYDPFCGTGVVLQEALLMGRKAYGSDLNAAMVDATRENLEWLKNKTELDLFTPEVTVADARHVILPTKQLSIVSEGYLGANLSSPPAAEQLRILQDELVPLYIDSLINFASQLTTGCNLAITFPAWKTAKGLKFLPVIDQITDLGYSIKVFKHVDSRKLIYRRPDQIVGRQLLLLRRNT
jgi:tRNA G10  N-methylase Trm11